MLRFACPASSYRSSGDKIQPYKPSATELTRLAGNFYSDELGVTYALSVDKGRLIVKKPDNTEVPLDAAIHNEFYSSNIGTIVFHMDANHHVSGLTVFTQEARGIIFTRVN